MADDRRRHGSLEQAVTDEPVQKRKGTLKLAIASGFGPVALQMKTTIIDRVNAAFGYRAVSEVVFVQTCHRAPRRRPAPDRSSLKSSAQRPLGRLMPSWKR